MLPGNPDGIKFRLRARLLILKLGSFAKVGLDVIEAKEGKADRLALASAWIGMC